MATPDLTVKRGDLWPPVEATLNDSAETVFALTGATVRFLMRGRDGTLVVDQAATIVDAATREVKYEWQAGDTNTVGSYLAEWQVTFPGAKPATFPSRSYLTIEIEADLNP